MSNLRHVCLAIATLLSFATPTFAATYYGPLQVDKLIVMPARDGHADWISAIQNARQSVHLEMYHLTDRQVINVLAKKAQSGVEVKVILDGASFKGGYQKAVEPMLAAGAQVRPSTSAFSLTHEKGMVIDGSKSFVTAINLTNTADNSRDFGIITSDAGVAADMEAVFNADWDNSQTGGNETPYLSQPNLIWSPTNSRQKLVDLIDSATQTIIMQVESFSDGAVIQAFGRAAKRGVDVQVMTPECAGGNGTFNFAALAKLSQAGVKTHVMPGPASFDQPYIHSKMIVVDRSTIYIGSVNFTFNSLDHDRELGVIFQDYNAAGVMSDVFDQDWARAVDPQQPPAPGLCHAS